MSLFDTLVQTALQKTLGDSGAAQNLASSVLNMLQNQSSGGLTGLLDKFKSSGLGDIAASWVSKGENKPVSPEQIVEALGQEQVEEIAKEAGIPAEKGASALSEMLPSLIDKLTPDGVIPDISQMSTMSKVLLGVAGVAGAAMAAKAAASAFGDKEDEAGASETAAVVAESASTENSASTASVAASAATNRTYTVVSGDNLSKIAKHFYGDANQWSRIFEANTHILKDPDRINPGQVLNIP